ncbi:hypothetical protein [Cutibacterium avidum]|uniref:hypothetical protein n=1 Tax=Cutibacterium avidum TaxID=33010 RepID=UPI000AFF71E8|nr:hypothetical protein [Cutibacterium avidum]MDK7698830.1 hypothetical protein [Cutibacterium avidum]
MGSASSIVRLAGAVLAEQTDEWVEGCRYRSLEVLGPLTVSLWYPTPTSNTQTTTYQP